VELILALVPRSAVNILKRMNNVVRSPASAASGLKPTGG
jgi:hypothetical protein